MKLTAHRAKRLFKKIQNLSIELADYVEYMEDHHEYVADKYGDSLLLNLQIIDAKVYEATEGMEYILETYFNIQFLYKAMEIKILPDPTKN